MMVKLPRSPTLDQNSVDCGAISRTDTTPTMTQNETCATRPRGTVLGSVIMKNMKISTSGEVTIARQNSNPQTGANAQRAVMQCPAAATRPMPAARVTQNAMAPASRWRRRVMASPPTTITA